MSDYEVGMKTRREVLGDEHVDRAAATAGSFGAPWQEFITRYAWGGVWSRPGLDRRTRSAITLAALISMHAENEIGMHVRAALRNGLTVEEINEVFIHTAVYAGVPASNSALAVARRSSKKRAPSRPRVTESGVRAAFWATPDSGLYLPHPSDLGAVRAGDGHLRR